MKLSVVIPVYNERENVRPLCEALRTTLDGLNRAYEIIFVDDGSTDGSLRELDQLADDDERVVVIALRHNFGQSAALCSGMGAARGDVIITLDGDLQNDPADIPLLLEKLQDGYDLVHGWRKDRHDPFLSRRVPSRIANWLIAKATGLPVHDLGCGLKVMRREVARELRLYGEMHRFIPILAHWRGARCAEVVTRHHARQFGQSKYGLSRTLRVLLDLVTVKYLTRYLTSPMKLFGFIGLVCLLAGLVSFATTLGMKAMQQIDMTGNPLLLLSAISTLLGLQFFGLGMLGEMGVRIYYEIGGQGPFAIRRTRNLQPSFPPPEARRQEQRAA